MAGLTKQAIKASFFKLLNEQPLSKISVRDIVEDCGINRNSFYYHYRDIPALIEEIITEAWDAMVQQYPTITDLHDCCCAVMETALQNRRVVFHIYNSVSRDAFEQYLMRFCEYAVETYLTAVFAGQEVSGDKRRLVVRMLKCSLFGMSIDWLSGGMKPEGRDELLRLLTLCHGLSEELLRRCKEKTQAG